MSVLSERTGLGPLETAVLLTLDDAWARHDRPHAKCAKMMTLVSDRFGSGSNYAYEVLCDLARPWLVGLSLVDFHGNFGSPDFPPARPAFTECRLTPVGGLAVAAERGEGSPLPLGLINGTVYQGGTRPPFNPIGVVRSVLTALDEPSASDAHLAGIAGPPCFPGGCQLDGEVDRVLAGQPGVLVLRAQLAVTEIAGRKAIDITKLPPIVGTVMLRESLIARIEGEPICIDDWHHWMTTDEAFHSWMLPT